MMEDDGLPEVLSFIQQSQCKIHHVYLAPWHSWASPDCPILRTGRSGIYNLPLECSLHHRNIQSPCHETVFRTWRGGRRIRRSLAHMEAGTLSAGWKHGNISIKRSAPNRVRHYLKDTAQFLTSDCIHVLMLSYTNSNDLYNNNRRFHQLLMIYLWNDAFSAFQG